MWEQFNILNLNLCLALAGGHVCMLLGQLEVIQADRHACTAIGKKKTNNLYLEYTQILKLFRPSLYEHFVQCTSNCTLKTRIWNLH